MHRLPWAIVVAAGLLTMAWTGSSFRYVITAAALRDVLGQLSFWTWLAALVIVLLAFIRMWQRHDGDARAPGFDVVRRKD